eukprot:TRINITY_DN13512_c0_g1_i2.p1 TRINITY_DN13512_c0_g1~~TRINITY_DN13512_c0_g1_i2.p1  ORF type:complete len:137 (-),score=15.05 TRINITY_DN13512_c0_g1_i2:76-486(-)
MYGRYVHIRPLAGRIFGEAEVKEPYVRVIIGTRAENTRWRAKGRNPVWEDEEIVFPYSPYDEWVVLELFDHDRHQPGNDIFIGGGCFSLNALVNNREVTQWIRLYNKNVHIADIYTSMQYVTEPGFPVYQPMGAPI